MSEQIDEAVNRYCGHYSKQLEQIQFVTGASAASAYLFKKTLFCSFLDALSRSVYPQKKPWDRFTSLVRKFWQWSDQDRISLPHLVRLLQLNQDSAFDKVRKFSIKKFASWDAHWNEIKLDQDPEVSEVETYWPKSGEYRMSIESVRLEPLKHLHLLYSHRNFLIHELRSPGYGMDYADIDEPYYHSMTTVNSLAEPPIETMELVYPLRFFKRLCDNVLTELEQYFNANQISPFDNYRFGSYWIERLN